MKAVLAVWALAPALALSACVVTVDSQGHITRDEKRFTVSGTPDVKLVTFDGSIEIRSWDKNEVLVEIEKRGPSQEVVDRLEIASHQDGNRVEVEVKKPEGDSVFFGIGRHTSPTARLIVTMPGEANVNARSGDGSIRIERVRGRLDLRTGDGSIRATDIGGQMSLTTGDGSVTLDGGDGELELETGDGGVNVAGKLAVVKIHTGDGSISFRAGDGTEMTGDWSISTGDGGITLQLPAHFGAMLDAHTGDGSIRNELDVIAGDGGEVSRRTVRGRLGDGGRTLKVRTGDGSIRLREG
ncbi:MAG TPA: DUF4097 family beta strand repeat-containing protein [Vicinamibacterales bacterium]|nr:DUF4097 family beta strand repeat-containing protein [Vicinamibacterales bacterium]